MQDPRHMQHLLQSPPRLMNHIMRMLQKRNARESIFSKGITSSRTTSAVLFLLGKNCGSQGPLPEPCVILNKRSAKVRQPGDLCFPGGSISPRWDAYLSRVLNLPFLTLRRWPYWSQWRYRRSREARRLAVLLATSLREGVEEMGLNPFGVKFLGPLPSESLYMFRRVIYPMAGWIARQKRFVLNWEVEKMVYIPLRDLLNPAYYARYRLGDYAAGHPHGLGGADFPCFVHQDYDGEEILWGATFRMVVLFLETVFGFKSPRFETLPVVHGSLDQNYYSGSG